MTHKRSNPGARDAGAADDFYIADDYGTYTGYPPCSSEEFRTQPPCRWLHVKSRGDEIWFGRKPTEMPTLCVELVKVKGRRRCEQTATCNIVLIEHAGLGEPATVTRVKPRGTGWQPYAGDRFHTVWRRPHNRGAS